MPRSVMSDQYAPHGVMHDGALRKNVAASADRWLAQQCDRLNTTPAVILAAVRERGWTAQEISKVDDAALLASVPPITLIVVERNRRRF